MSSSALGMLNRSAALSMNRSAASKMSSNATMLTTGNVQSGLRRFAVEVRRENAKLLPTPSMNSNARQPMKINAAPSMRKSVKL